MTKLPSLEAVLQYQNPLVIKRFKRNNPKLEHKAEILFLDMLKYLWLCKKHELDLELDKDNPNLNFTCVMHQEMIDIDEMWHTFILITKDYAAFCQEYFGEFLHHIPEMVNEDAKGEKNIDEQAVFQHELELFLSYVYEKLGEETVKSWFAVYVT